MTQIELRPVRRDELEVLREIAIVTMRDTFDPFNSPEDMKAYIDEALTSERIAGEFDEADSCYYFATDNEKIVGYMRVRKNPEAEAYLGTNTIELQRLYVLPDQKGKQIGSVLMREAIRYATDRKCEWLWLGVWEGNLPAQRFYKRWGFERFSEHVFVMGNDPQTDWLLCKKL